MHPYVDMPSPPRPSPIAAHPLSLSVSRATAAASPPRLYQPRPRRAATLAVLLALSLATPAAAADPLNTIRAFCQADGRGERLAPRTWPRVGNLVSWPLEPAWDHVYLIRGFEIGTPRRVDDDLTAEIQYTVVSEVGSSGIKATARVETRRLRLGRDGDGIWRIRPPAPPPYVFASEADPEALAALLAPDSDTYESNSAFVWHLFRGAGWAMPYADTAALATDSNFASERSAEPGDLVLYYDGEQPYHVGIVESEDSVVSATLNGGIRRTPFGAFAGEIRYRRPVATAPTPAAGPESAAQAGGR